MSTETINIDKAIAFFYEHAGYSVSPGETQEQGKRRTAERLARAELHATAQGWSFVWSDDWEVGSHTEYYGPGSAYEDREPDTCENCDLFDADGDMIASLCCIDDADNNYRRVIEAELADEALSGER